MSQTPPPQPPHDPTTDQTVVIRYTNWKGETADRRIVPHDIHFGSNEWHPEPQWLMTAFDFGKFALRTFALKGISWWVDEKTYQSKNKSNEYYRLLSSIDWSAPVQNVWDRDNPKPMPLADVKSAMERLKSAQFEYTILSRPTLYVSLPMMDAVLAEAGEGWTAEQILTNLHESCRLIISPSVVAKYGLTAETLGFPIETQDCGEK